MRAVIAIAAAEDLELESVDISTAFLNGEIDAEIYANIPELFTFSAALCSSSNLPGSPSASPALNGDLNLGWRRPTLRVFIPCTFFPVIGVLNAPGANGAGVAKDAAGALLVGGWSGWSGWCGGMRRMVAIYFGFDRLCSRRWYQRSSWG